MWFVQISIADQSPDNNLVVAQYESDKGKPPSVQKKKSNKRRPNRKSDTDYQESVIQQEQKSVPEDSAMSTFNDLELQTTVDLKVDRPTDEIGEIKVSEDISDNDEDSSRCTRLPSASDEDVLKMSGTEQTKKHGHIRQPPSKPGKSSRKPTITSQDAIDEIVAKKFFSASSKPKRRNRSKPGRKGPVLTDKVIVIVQSCPPLLEELSQDNWNCHFSKFLPEISDVCYFHPEDEEEFHIRVTFQSSPSAMKAVSALNDTFICGIYKLSLHSEISDETTKSVPQVVHIETSVKSASDYERDRDCLLKHIAVKKSECEEKRKKELVKLKEILSSKTEAVSRFIEQKNQRLKFSTDESILRREVFLKYCDQIQATLEGPRREHGEIDLLRAGFDREVKRYKKKLPIYAHRLGLMETIERHQVCMVVGETGAGRSTQLVQYLNEAGYADNGVIVCTQRSKLAAISLAGCVSTEVNEEVGGTYGYIAGRSKRGKNTRVMYMTDYTLLNECIADPTLSKYSCLVIDEAHKRSIHTDMLIAFIKRCLPSRKDLKVIIVSAAINPALFSSYFGGPPIVEIPAWTYPVEVTWKNHQKPIADRDYVTEAVNKVCDIHVDAQGEPGDVLVFLTCPAEIERACELVRDALKNEAVVLPLHDKLQPEDYNKIFIGTQKGKRKVVFSTDLAETSVVIPNIKYVVDTGLSKELCYDPVTNVSTIEIRPISKSSANQRKDRVGRTSSGECYRLYSKEDHADMQDDSSPEILCSSLASVVVKLYKFGIRDVHCFEFVESPDKKVLDEAIENLKFLGAIKDGELTQLGEKMASLPLDPSLSKILFDAIGHGIGAAAAAAVAISSLAGSVFFSSYSAELQHKKRTLPFCQQSGDQMTYLHAYFEWFQRKKNTKWGMDVNSNSMQMVKQMVEELQLVLKQACNTKIQSEITSNSLSKADKVLPKLFFDAFLQNMCVYLGHHQAGYWSEKLPDEQLVGSSLHYLNSVPQCVVYEKTQKTKQRFLLQALPVREEWIQEAIESGKLPCHPADSGWFQCYRVSPLIFTNLGPTLMSKMQEEYPHWRNATLLDCEVQPVFEYLKYQGTLQVFAQQEHHDQIRKLIMNYVDSVKEELKEQSYKCSMAKFNDDVMVVIGVGGCIKQIMISDEYQAVIVRGLSQMLVPEVEEELERYGQCSTNTSYRDRGGVLLYVQYSNPSDAAKALQHRFYEPGLRVLRYKEYNTSPSSLTIEWQRRQRKEVCAKFLDSNLDDYLSIISDESGLSFNPTGQKSSILISGIRDGMTDKEIRQRLLVNFPRCKEEKLSLYTHSYSDAFKDTGASYSKLRTQLDRILAEFAKESDYRMEFNRPKPNDFFYRASFRFEDSVLCCRLVRRLCGRRIGCVEDPHSELESDRAHSDGCDDELPIYQIRSLSLFSSTRYTPQVFSVIKSSVQYVCDHYCRSSQSVAIKRDKLDRWGNGFVDVTGTDLTAFTEAKKMLSEAVEPETLSFCGGSTCQYLSTVNFQKIMGEIQSRTSTYIRLSACSLGISSVAIFGTKTQRERAKEEMELQLQNMVKNGVRCFEVNLKEHGPGLMKHLIGEYGSDVENIPQALEGITAAKLHPSRQILTLFATETGYETFLCSLAKFKPANSIPQDQLSECCVCFNTPNSKNFSTPLYRLEYCGHVYCRECIEQQLHAASIEFPVTCAADECKEQLVWKDFENLVTDKEELCHITTASFKSYITTNPDKIRNCITPGCDMVYAVPRNDRRFVCRHCRANICSQCHTTWHEGFDSCEAFENCSRESAETIDEV